MTWGRSIHQRTLMTSATLSLHPHCALMRSANDVEDYEDCHSNDLGQNKAFSLLHPDLVIRLYILTSLLLLLDHLIRARCFGWQVSETSSCACPGNLLYEAIQNAREISIKALLLCISECRSFRVKSQLLFPNKRDSSTLPASNLSDIDLRTKSNPEVYILYDLLWKYQSAVMRKLCFGRAIFQRQPSECIAAATLLALHNLEWDAKTILHPIWTWISTGFCTTGIEKQYLTHKIKLIPPKIIDSKLFGPVHPPASLGRNFDSYDELWRSFCPTSPHSWRLWLLFCVPHWDHVFAGQYRTSALYCRDIAWAVELSIYVSKSMPVTIMNIFRQVAAEVLYSSRSAGKGSPNSSARITRATFRKLWWA